MSEKKKIEITEDFIENISPTIEDFMARRINHIPFAKVVCWLSFMGKKQDFIYTSELSNFNKSSTSHSHNILRCLCKVGLLFRKQVGSLVEYHFCKNGDSNLIDKYIDIAKKTLDLN